MTTIDTPSPADAGAEHAEGALSGVSAFFAGLADWVTSTDHKKIGRLYTGFGLVVLAAAAVVGVLIGLERADDSSALIDTDAVLQLFQVYRVGLVLGGIIPLTLGLAVAIAPLQLGARSIAFPRLALTGFYAWLGGLSLTIVALVRNGGVGGGNGDSVDLFLVGIGLTAVGVAATALCVATSVLTTRAPGMTMRRVPLFAWSALVGSLAILIVVPVLVGTIIYLVIDHRLGIDANFSGSEAFGAWTTWALTVPAVAAFSIPAIGVAAELFPVTFRARQALRGVTFAGIALVAVTALAATTHQYVHPVEFDTDQTFSAFAEDAVTFLVFAGLPLLGALIVLGLGALTAKHGVAAGRPRFVPAFVFSFIGFALIALGLLANAIQSIVDLELIGTSIEEGATLWIVYGSLLAVIGGLTFWAPKLWGRVLPAAKVLPLALAGIGGGLLAGLAPVIGGFLDQPGGVPNNDAAVARLLSLDHSGSAELLAIVGVVGHALVALSVLGLLGLLLVTTTGTGEQADENPFGAHTIEWRTLSPAPADNYVRVPTVNSPEPLFDSINEGSAE